MSFMLCHGAETKIGDQNICLINRSRQPSSGIVDRLPPLLVTEEIEAHCCPVYEKLITP